LSYGESRTFALLTLIFDTVDTSKALHMDHIFPISLFKRRRLIADGVPVDQFDDLVERANMLPNLQLIEGAINQEKLGMLPAAWLRKREPDIGRREKYIYIHMLEGLPETVRGFAAFYEDRRTALRTRISQLLIAGSENAEHSAPPQRVPAA
jgi:hypothetical protein